MLVGALLLTGVILSGCTINAENETTKDNILKFQTTKAMDDAGMTVENTENLKVLADIIEENPQVGEDNSLSIQYSGKYGNTNGVKQVTFFVINKTDLKVKNISFYFTMQAGEKYIFDNILIELPEETLGVLQPYSAMPFTITVGNGEYPLLAQINDGTLEIEVSTTDFLCEYD